MSGENTAVIRRVLDAFNGGDLEAMLTEYHAEAELYPMRAQLEGTVYRGHDGLRRWLDDLEEDWDFMHMEAEEFREADDAVVVLGRLRSRGRASGVDIEVPMGLVWRLRDGKVAYSKAYSDQADALRAAGLE